MGRRIRNEILERILKLRRTKSIRQTAKLLEISTTTVRNHCDKRLAEILRRWTPPVDAARNERNPPPPPARLPPWRR